jgi:nucleoside-diphosphate-sugar epimerase
MKSRILVLGAAGRFGHVAAGAFRSAGWKVASLVRPGAGERAPKGTEVLEVDALDHAAVVAAARGADVILHALNPPYTAWQRQALPLAYSAISAVEMTGATLLFPGNLYNYGSPLPAVIDETTPMRPTSRKGQIRLAIEERMAEAAERGARVIILRAGDFYGSGHGGWLDLVIAKDIDQGRLTYPGRLDVQHEWAYLPDLAAALVRLADIRETLARFKTFGFPGHAVTGEEFTQAIAKASGQALTIKRMTWWLVHALRPLFALPRELSEIAYLWQEPHQVAGDRLKEAIGEIPRTPLDRAVWRALEDLRTHEAKGTQR